MLEKRGVLKSVLANLDSGSVNRSLILRAYDLLDYVRQKEDGHGITLVVGYNPDIESHQRTVAEMERNVFEETDEHLNDDHMPDRLNNIREIDGAMLIDPSGNFLMSGIYFLVNPIFTLKKLGIPREDPRSLHEKFGFKHRVGTRHISSISASYKLTDAFVISLSEESKLIRIFYNGRILFSELFDEMQFFPLVAVDEKITYPVDNIIAVQEK